MRVTQPPVKQMEAQALELPNDDDIWKMQQYNGRENEKHLRERLEEVKSVLPDDTRRAAVLATEKGTSSWLTVIPLEDMNFTLNKTDFRMPFISTMTGT